MPRKKQVQTRVASDTKEELEEYRENRDLSQADALRRLIRDGLDHAEFERDDTEADATDEWDDVMAVNLTAARIGGLIVALALVGFAVVELGATVAAAGGLAFVGAALGAVIGTAGGGR